MKDYSYKWYSGAFLLYGISGGLLFIHVNRAIRSEFTQITFLLALLLPIGLVSGLAIGTVWLCSQRKDGENILLIGGWSLIGTITFSIGAALIILYQNTMGIIMADRIFMIANTASGGAVGGFVLGLYDHRKRQAQREAMQLNQKITVLNRVLRHDIRTRANIIFGNVEILYEKLSRKPDELEKITEQVEEIVEIGNQAKEIENIIREETREPEVIDIVPLIKTSCEGVTQEYPTAKINITLPESQPVVAHPLVESALNNIVENAIEHNDKTTPEIRISCESILKNGDKYVEIRISDNGPGIPQNEIKVIENGHETDLNHLSGLGLWLVNWIVTNSNGDVQFEPNEPEGSIVCLQFKSAAQL